MVEEVQSIDEDDKKYDEVLDALALLQIFLSDPEKKYLKSKIATGSTVPHLIALFRYEREKVNPEILENEQREQEEAKQAAEAVLKTDILANMETLRKSASASNGDVASVASKLKS